MNYNAAITDFFKSPQWRMNLLFGAVCVLIPVVGPIVLTGWIITALWGREDDRDPASQPPFDFSHFVKYLERGLWPFLVQLVTCIVIIPAAMASILIPIAATAESGMMENGLVATLLVGAAITTYLVAIICYHLVTTPLILRATLSQDFVTAFNIGFAKQFLGLMWKDILGVLVFLLVVGIAMAVLAVITCYIGAIAASPLVIYAWNHLIRQLYQKHLERGGEPVPRSPKLNDQPPPLPVQAD